MRHLLRLQAKHFGAAQVAAQHVASGQILAVKDPELCSMHEEGLRNNVYYNGVLL